MDCPNRDLLLQYSGDELSPMERMRVREHLVVCPHCRAIISDFKIMEGALKEPVWLDPPMDIEKRVMKALFPQTPSKISLGVLMTLSAALFIAILYVTFDVANNGVLTALQIGGAETTSLIGSLIRMITISFKVIYAFYKIVDAFARAMTFGLLSIEMLLMIVSVTGLIVARTVFHRNSARQTGK